MLAPFPNGVRLASTNTEKLRCPRTRKANVGWEKRAWRRARTHQLVFELLLDLPQPLGRGEELVAEGDVADAHGFPELHAHGL